MFKKILLTLTLLLSFSAFSVDTFVLTPNNHILINDEINDTTMSKASRELAEMSSRLKPSDTITIVLDSPGGSVIAGNDFIDLVDSVPQKIQMVTLNAASMAFSIFQHADVRLITPKGVLMQHRPAITLSGSFNQGEVESRLKLFTTITNEQIKYESKKMGITEEQFRALVHNELWLMGQEAVDNKAADKVVNLSCSKSLLKKVNNNELRTMFGTVTYKTSACPLVKGIFDVKMN